MKKDRFKDGDIVTYTDDDTIAIFKKKIPHGFVSYCNINSAGTLITFEEELYDFNMRLINNEEKTKFLKLLKEKGYRWDTKNKKLIRYETLYHKRVR